MDGTSPEIMTAMRTRLRYLGERQSVISQNIANANTPDYLAKDVKTPSFSELLGGSKAGGVALHTTSDKHISASQNTSHFKLIEQAADETSPDGNSVVLEEQMMHMAKTNMDYQTTLNLYSKIGALIKAALGSGN